MKVTIFKPDGIGDFVLATGCIKQVSDRVGVTNLELIVTPVVAPLARHQFPGAKVTELASPPYKSIVAGAQSIKDLISLSKCRRETLICFRHERTRFHQAALVCCRAKSLYWCTNSLEMQGFSDKFFALERILSRMTSNSLVTYPNYNESLRVCDEIRANIIALEAWVGDRDAITEQSCMPLLSGFNVAESHGLYVCPYSSSIIKDYPDELLCEVIADFCRDHQMPVILCGHVSQKRRLERLESQLRQSGLKQISVLASPRLIDFVEQLAMAKLVLTVDTAAAHLAAAMGKRAVIIFSGFFFKRFGPWQRSNKQRWLFRFSGEMSADHRTRYPAMQPISTIVPSEVCGALSEVLHL